MNDTWTPEELRAYHAMEWPTTLTVMSPLNARLGDALTEAAYADASARLTSPPRPLTSDEWVELRAASAVLQAQGGHPMRAVYAYLVDMASYPSALGPPPADIRERLLFAYNFISETGGDP